MRIKVTQLTAAQTTALTSGEWPEGFVVDHRQTYAILDGTPEHCLRVVQKRIVQERMNAVREANGTRDSGYRALIAVRTKLDLAKSSPTGVTSHVQVVPNGSDPNPEVPPVLNGTTRKGRGKAGRDVTQVVETTPQPAPVEAAPVKVAPVKVAAPVKVNVPGDAEAVANYRHMARIAESEGGRRYWESLIDSLRTGTEVPTNA